MSPLRFGYPIAFAVFVAVYVVTGLGSLALAPFGRAVSSIWLPSGVALGAMFFIGPRILPAVFAGAWLLAVLAGGMSLSLALLPATGNTLEPLVGWLLLTRATPGGFRLERVRDIVLLFAVAAVAPLVSVIAGSIALALGGRLATGSGLDAGLVWWFGDMVGVIAGTPLVFAWLRPPAQESSTRTTLPLSLWIGGITFLAVVAAAGIWRDLAYLFLIAPPVVLATLRWRMRGAATAVLATTIAIMLMAMVRPDLLHRPSPFEDLLLVQLALVVVAGVALLLAASLEGLDRAAQELRSTGEAYRALLDASPVPIVGRDLQGRFTLWNGAAERVFGWAESEIKGRLGDLVPPDAEAQFAWILAALRRGESITGAEVRRRARDGSIVEVSLSVAPVRDAAGEITGGVAVLTDLTAEKRALAALRGSEERFALAARASNDAIYDWDIAADTIWWSDSFAELFGHDVSALSACSDSWARLVHPADLPRVQASLRDAITGKADGWMAEYRFARADQSYALVYDRGYILRDPAGRALRMVGALSDITRRHEAESRVRESEERLRKLVENVLDVICEIDAGGIVRYASPSVRTVLGYEPAQFIGRSALDLVHFEDLEHAGRTLRRTFEEAGVVQRAEFRVRRADGEWAVFEASAKATTADDGTPIGVIAARDVTGRRELEERLRQATRLEAVGVLAGGVAHDFNNLLTSVLGHAELILGDVRGDDPIRPDLEEIRRAAHRAAELTRQLLAFSRRQVVAPRVVDFNQVIDGVATMLRRLLGEDITLDLDLARDLAPVFADAAQLEQVVVNLAANARDAMPKGGRLAIRSRMRPPPPDPRGLPAVLARSGQVTVLVEDTGEGMDAKTLAHVFEPFFTTKPPGRGTGLGLATCYGIISQAGGHISVESEVGRGTRFTIRLPPADLEGASLAEEAPEQALAGVGSETILLVEDETPVRQLALRVLRSAGFQVIAAPGPEEADRMANEFGGTIDLLLTDVVMPERSGPALAEGLVSRRPGLRVLFMSGYTDGQLHQHGVLKRGVALLAKPFTPEQLVRRVRAALDVVASR